MHKADSSKSAIMRADRKRLRGAQQYGARHRLTRRLAAPFVASGVVRCARGAECRFAEWVAGELVGGIIEPGSPWDLGHDDHRPWLHRGPEHASCNRGAPHRNQTSRVW